MPVDTRRELLTAAQRAELLALPTDRQAFALLPRVKITDLLIEVDCWCDFTRHLPPPASALQTSTVRSLAYDIAQIGRPPHSRLQLVLRENWRWRPAALWWKFSVPRDVPSDSVREDTALLTVLKFPFRVRTPWSVSSRVGCARRPPLEADPEECDPLFIFLLTNMIVSSYLWLP